MEHLTTFFTNNSFQHLSGNPKTELAKGCHDATSWLSIWPRLPVLCSTTEPSAFCVHSTSWMNSIPNCTQSKCGRNGRKNLKCVFYECLVSSTSTSELRRASLRKTWHCLKQIWFSVKANICPNGHPTMPLLGHTDWHLGSLGINELGTTDI